MIWLWLACGIGGDNPPSSTVEKSLMVPSEQALMGINHIQEETKRQPNSLSMFKFGTHKAVPKDLLASLFNGTIVRDEKDLLPQHLLLVILEEKRKQYQPSHPNIVAVLKGEWSEKSRGTWFPPPLEWLQ